MCTAAGGHTKAEGQRQIETVVERNNLWLGMRVMRNKDAAEDDGLTLARFHHSMKQNSSVC